MIAQAGERRLARFESLRALAALGVVVGHAWGLHYAFGPAALDTLPKRLVYGGGFGVFVFFALSGYLLFLPLARAAFGDGARVDLRTYARNRALRILPLYYVVVAVLLVTEGQTGGPVDWLRYATFTQNFFSDLALRLDGPIWSLVVEVQFYALLPLIAWLLARAARRDLRIAAALLVVLGAAGAALRAALLHGTPDRRVVYSLAVTSFFFVPGMLLALARLAWERRPEMRLPGPLEHSDVWALAALAAWVVVLDRWATDLTTALACGLTVAAVALPLRRGLFVAALDGRVLALVGVASYSLYLWHLPLETSVARHISTSWAAMFALAVPASIAVAFASYHAVEAPFLRLRRRWVGEESGRPDSNRRLLAPKASALARLSYAPSAPQSTALESESLQQASTQLKR
jgi:peptidoglycan/LPS O-acetylase OafA/YrhL